MQKHDSDKQSNERHLHSNLSCDEVGDVVGGGDDAFECGFG